MQSRDFCFWLQGFFELGGPHSETGVISREQADAIRKHLALVFKHEIDPEMGSQVHQEVLDDIHGRPDGPILFRC